MMVKKNQQKPQKNQLLLWKKPLNLEKLLLFLCIFFLPTQLGKHFWPDFSYIFSLRIDYLSPTLYLWDILILILFIYSFTKNKNKSLNKKALLLLILFLCSQGISLVNAVNPWAGLVRLEQFFIGSLFAWYLTSKDFRETSPTIFWALLSTLFLESIISLGQFFNQGSLGLWIFGERSFTLSTPSIANFNWYGQLFLRPYATFPHPNLMGAYMCLAILTCLFLSLYTQLHLSEFKKLVFRSAMFLAFVAGLLSFSRGVIIILFFEALFVLRKKIKLFLLIFLIALPVAYIRLSSALNFDNLSIIRRDELAKLALSQFQSSPILGVGLNNFLNMSSTSDLVSGPSRFFQPVHNIFLLTLSETGLLGYVGFLLFLTYPLFLLRQVKDFKIILYISAVLLIIISLGMFDHYFLTLAPGQRLLFLVWGLSLAIISSTIEKNG
jgi:O-antigen ligase